MYWLTTVLLVLLALMVMMFFIPMTVITIKEMCQGGLSGDDIMAMMTPDLQLRINREKHTLFMKDLSVLEDHQLLALWKLQDAGMKYRDNPCAKHLRAVKHLIKKAQRKGISPLLIGTHCHYSFLSRKEQKRQDIAFTHGLKRKRVVTPMAAEILRNRGIDLKQLWDDADARAREIVRWRQTFHFLKAIQTQNPLTKSGFSIRKNTEI